MAVAAAMKIETAAEMRLRSELDLCFMVPYSTETTRMAADYAPKGPVNIEFAVLMGARAGMFGVVFSVRRFFRLDLRRNVYYHAYGHL